MQPCTLTEFAPCVGGSDDADMSVYEELQRKFVTSIRPQLQTNCEILISALQQFQEMKVVRAIHRVRGAGMWKQGKPWV